MTNKQYALIGLSAPVIFAITYFIMSNQRPEYSFLTKAVSELGSLDAPNKWVWNIIGYIIPGILISVFSYGLFKGVTDSSKSKWPLIGIFLSGLFMIISGVFPGDFDNRESTTMILHTIGSIGSYIFFLIGAFTYPRLMKQSAYWKTAIVPSLTLTWLTIFFGNWQFVFPEMPGAGQRIVFCFYFLWIAFNAVKLFNHNTKVKTDLPSTHLV